MGTKFRGGELVVKVLEEFGARRVFGVPGGQTLFVTDPMKDSTVKFVHNRHENGAAAAADGWGRLTGEPGVCLATTGPGATNLITAIGGAYRDSSPLIALVFQNRLADAGKGDAQESDHEILFGSICKKYIPVRSASSVVWAMREAYRVSKTGRPGPVVVDLYRDVVEEQFAEYEYVSPDQYCVENDAIPSDESIEKAVEIIKKSSKICLWIGNGVKISNAAEEVKKLSDLIKAPIVSTYNAICAIDSDYENLIGPRSRHGSKVSKAAIEEADCVILVGSSLTAISTNRWAIKANNIIQIDIVPENIGRHYPVSCGVVGDAKQALNKLTNSIISKGYVADSKYRDEMIARRNELKSETIKGEISDLEKTPVPPIAVQLQLEKLLKPDSVFVVDAGNPGAWTHLTSFPKNTTYIKAVNYGNMGFALGASIGCKEAAPEKEVIAYLGDGSLGMTLGELETISRENLDIIVLLVNDSAYGNIKQEELFKMGENRYTGVEFPEIDYTKVAEAFGFGISIINKASELPKAFEEARNAKKPYMIEVKLDGSYTVWPEIF